MTICLYIIKYLSESGVKIGFKRIKSGRDEINATSPFHVYSTRIIQIFLKKQGIRLVKEVSISFFEKSVFLSALVVYFYTHITIKRMKIAISTFLHACLQYVQKLLRIL